MRGLILTAVLAAAPLARGQEPKSAADPRLYAEPSADTSATGWACTAETLETGAECVFESQAGPAADPARQAIENAAAAARLGERLCRDASRHPWDPIPDPDVLAACRRIFAENAMACGAHGERALLDEAGRFGAEFRVCYAAMGEALSRARTMSRTSARCCRCLVGNKCLAAADRCNADAISRLLAGATAACAAERCPEACDARIPWDGGGAQPTPARPAEPPPSPPVSRFPPPPETYFAPTSPCFDPIRMEQPCVW
jgi:hypothetical protein